MFRRVDPAAFSVRHAGPHGRRACARGRPVVPVRPWLSNGTAVRHPNVLRDLPLERVACSQESRSVPDADSGTDRHQSDALISHVCWGLPAQLEIRSWVPLVVVSLGSSRQVPELALTSAPLGGGLH